MKYISGKQFKDEFCYRSKTRKWRIRSHRKKYKNLLGIKDDLNLAYYEGLSETSLSYIPSNIHGSLILNNCGIKKLPWSFQYINIDGRLVLSGNEITEVNHTRFPWLCNGVIHLENNPIKKFNLIKNEKDPIRFIRTQIIFNHDNDRKRMDYWEYEIFENSLRKKRNLKRNIWS